MVERPRDRVILPCSRYREDAQGTSETGAKVSSEHPLIDSWLRELTAEWTHGAAGDSGFRLE